MKKIWNTTTKNWVCGILACMALMITLNADLSSISAEAAQGGFFNVLAMTIKKLEYVLPVFTYRDGLLALLVLFFFQKTTIRQESGISPWSVRIPAGFTAFFLVFGYSFYYTNSWDLIIMDKLHLFLAAVMMVGYYALFVRIFHLVVDKLPILAAACGERPGKWSELVFERHAFWGPFLVILICWMPYILAKFPGASMPETLAEMRQFYWNDINNYYPPMHTILLSLMMQLGNAVHSYTLGFFLNLVLQLGMLLSAFAYGFTLMRRWQTPYKLRWAALAIICIVEFFPMESTVVEKDIPYAGCVIFLVLLLYELVRQMHKGNGMNRVQMAGYVLACIGTAGFRNEGIYLVLVSGIAVTFYVMHTWWKEDRRKCGRVLLTVLLPVLLVLFYQKGLLPACGVADNGPKEALSIPFQQTARYVRDYGYEISEEDAEIISRVLDYENLAEKYDPITSDPVKYTYHAETTEDLTAYFGLWFRQLLKHPGNAVEATMNNAYGWFYQEGYAQNYMMTSKIDGQDVRWEINQPAKLAGVRQVMERVAKWLSRVPVLNWFENAGIVSWLTILLTAFLIGAGRKRYLLPMAPVLTALMVCIAAPTFNYQMRYIMPIMFCVPFYAAMAVQALREKL